MKFRFKGSIEDLTRSYADAKNDFNAKNPSKSSPLSVRLHDDKIEIDTETGASGVYRFVAPLDIHEDYIDLEGEIVADRDMRMRWYDWIGLSIVFVITCIPMLIACLITKSSPFGTKKKREARLRSYMCEYLNCEIIE